MTAATLPEEEAERKCRFCQKPLPESYRNQKRYCSKSCYSNYGKAEYRAQNPHVGHCTTGQTGGLSELLVCADLLRQGYDVFRAVAQSCSCDLVVLCKGQLLRIEVKTAYRTKAGLKFPGLRQGQAEKFDILAMVWLDNNEIRYEPPLPE